MISWAFALAIWSLLLILLGVAVWRQIAANKALVHLAHVNEEYWKELLTSLSNEIPASEDLSADSFSSKNPASMPQPQESDKSLQLSKARPIKGNSSNLFEESMAFFEKHKDELLRNYEGTYIAIIDNEVVDSDEDGVALALRVYEKYGYKAIYMPKVEREPRKFRIVSPRLLR